MEVELDAEKTLEQNAAVYAELAKKLKKKREGVLKALEETRKKIRSLENKRKYEKEALQQKPVRVKVSKERQWFEKFHYFHSSEGLLCLAGRDAKQNELLVAKHLEKSDLFFHADVHGASAVVLKEGQSASDQSKKEAAQFAACFSSAWKAEFAVVDVFSAKPEQVSKYSHGEYVAKGGFMIYGKKEYFRGVPLKLYLCQKEGGLFILSESVSHEKIAGIKKVLVVPGPISKSEAAKKLVKALAAEEIPNALEEIVRLLPGSVRL